LATEVSALDTKQATDQSSISDITKEQGKNTEAIHENKVGVGVGKYDIEVQRRVIQSLATQQQTLSQTEARLQGSLGEVEAELEKLTTNQASLKEGEHLSSEKLNKLESVSEDQESLLQELESVVKDDALVF
jgi:chromosome segregation ATPase